MLVEDQMRCCLCDGTEFRPLFHREFRVEACRTCGLVRTVEPNRNLSKYYALEYWHRAVPSPEGRPAAHRRRNRAVLRWLQGNMADLSRARVLEIGCSTGYLLKEIAKTGASVSGIEPCLHSSAIARKQNGITDIQCCMLEDAQEGDRYDAIVLIQTFEHFPAPLEALQKIGRLLKPDGRLFLEVPNFLSRRGLYRGWRHGAAYPSYNHLFAYTRRTLAGLLRKAGFEVCQVEGHQNLRTVARLAPCAAHPGRPAVSDYGRVLAAWNVMRVFYAGCGVFARLASRTEKHEGG